MPNSTAQTFADHAITLLEADYDRPQIATVQSFAILSCYEAIRTRDARGWLYAGNTRSFSVAGNLLIISAARNGYETGIGPRFTC